MSYVEPSPNYDGKADISVVGGSKLLQYSLTGGVTWFKVYDKDGKIIKLSDTEISNIPRVIYFKEPNTPTYISYELWAENPPYPIIPRAITILPVSGATLSHTGLVFAESGKDFVLTITVADQTKEPKVTTGRNLPADQDVVSEYLGNGVYKITIKRVTSPINLGIDLVAGSEAVDGSSVWSAGGQLYVTGVTAATAQIYGATGTLVKQLTLGAGETTAVSLPAGFYIVTLNGKAYKVILK
ncbi:MAG: hypothetical protein LBS42_03795 [Tannerella sp.]|nr:hypothetical protein [Tannerella sp.]